MGIRIKTVFRFIRGLFNVRKICNLSIAVTKEGILQFTDKAGYASVEIQDGADIFVHHDIIGKQQAVFSVPVSEFAQKLAQMDTVVQ